MRGSLETPGVIAGWLWFLGVGSTTPERLGENSGKLHVGNMISPRTAAQVCRSRGLSLSDAQAIAALAEDEEDAKWLADLWVDNGERQADTPVDTQQVAR